MSHKFKASQIAQVLNGTLDGDPEVEVYKLAKIEEGSPGAITFLSNPKYRPFIYTTTASVVIVKDDFQPEQPLQSTLIRVADPYSAFTQLLEFYNQMRISSRVGIESSVSIDPSSSLGENVYIGAFTAIGAHCKIGNNVKIYANTTIGDHVIIADNTIIFSNVAIYADSVIGANCILHSGVVVGSYKKIPQIGNVVLEDNVELGANTTIDRATMGSTIIRQGVKIDNLVQIAHNVEVGAHTVIASQAGVAGSSKIGKHCSIGGQVGIAGHFTIGNNVKIQAQSGIGRNVKDNEVIQGSPAFTYMDYNKSYVVFRKLPELLKKIDELEKKLNEK